MHNLTGFGPLKVLVGCERSGIIRDAFSRLGHVAVSCDIMDSESLAGTHIIGDVENVMNLGWDLGIFCPPCRYVAASGARWFSISEERKRQQNEAIDFFKRLAACDIPKICLENPVGVISTRYRKPDQYIQPWQFGHGETKKTGLWLKNLPPLVPTRIASERRARIVNMSPHPDRGYLRSKFYPGVAEAMAFQWGGDCRNCGEFAH